MVTVKTGSLSNAAVQPEEPCSRFRNPRGVPGRTSLFRGWIIRVLPCAGRATSCTG